MGTDFGFGAEAAASAVFPSVVMYNMNEQAEQDFTSEHKPDANICRKRYNM